MRSCGDRMKISARLAVLSECAGTGGRLGTTPRGSGWTHSSRRHAPSSFGTAVAGQQRRSLVSVPKSKDWAIRPTTAISNPMLLSSSSSTRFGSAQHPSKNTQALLVAATEADRLLLNSATSNTTANDEKHSSTNKRQHPAFHDANNNNNTRADKNEQELLDAVNVLLLVSNDPVLQNFIATSSTRLKESSAASNELVSKQIATIHRAFLSLTKQCLDHCDSEHLAMLEPALELTRRAHDQLNLPFHLPLYKRLMEVAAESSSDHDKDSAVETILEIVSFCKALSPDAVRSAALYKPVLTIWIRQGKLSEAVRLLRAMENRFRVKSWDRPTVTDIYLQLHRTVKESVQTTGRRSFTEDLCAMIVEFLESAVLFLIVEQSRQKYLSLADIHKALDHMDEETVSQLNEEELRRHLDALSILRDQVDDDYDDDVETDDEARADDEMSNDPLDFVVHSILTKRVVTPAARREFARMIANHSLTTSSTPPVPRIVAIPAGYLPIGSSKYRAVLFRMDPAPPSPPRSFRPSMYGDYPLCYPDLNSQLTTLNIELTSAYEEYLCKRFDDSEDDDDDDDGDDSDEDDDGFDDDQDDFGDDESEDDDDDSDGND